MTAAARKFSLAVVILHYGKPALTERLYSQLWDSDPQWREHLFVLDNHAPEPWPRAWERTTHNLYWAGALQHTLERVGQAGYSHLWFLNNDLWFDSEPPHIKRAWMRHKRISRREGRVGVYAPSVGRSPYHPQMMQREGYQYRVAPYVDGIAPLIDLNCWRALGGVDLEGNDYGYGVDLWFSLSAHRAGWPVVVDHQVAVRHVYHSTARTELGFLDMAARAEAVYLRTRLGSEYKEEIDRLAQQCRDEEEI